RGALAGVADPGGWLAGIARLLTPDGEVVVAETDASRAQRLADLVDWSDAAKLGARVRAAEDALYEDAVRWDDDAWQGWATAAGLTLTATRDVLIHGDQRLSPEAVERWFGTPEAPGAYARALGAALEPDEVTDVAHRYRVRFAGQVVPWRTVVAIGRLSRGG
ncbi:MAG: hypothetical protein O3A02_04655, partial [bacterium]|nr:hypothetical protein [bacterium]